MFGDRQIGRGIAMWIDAAGEEGGAILSMRPSAPIVELDWM